MRAPRVGPWGPNGCGGGAVASESPGWRSSRSRAGSWAGSLLGGGRGQRRPSTFALVGRTGKGNVRSRRDGDVWGATSAAECTCTEREFGRCSRPTVRPGRTVHDERDHGDGSDTRPCGRRTSGSLTEIRVRDWQYWRERVGGPDHEPMPAGRDRPAGQDRPRRVHRARRTGRRRWRAGPCHRPMRATRSSC